MVSARRLIAGQENGSIGEAEVKKARTYVKIDQSLIIVFRCILFQQHSNSVKLGHLYLSGVTIVHVR